MGIKSFTSWQPRQPLQVFHQLAIDLCHWTNSLWHVVKWRCMNVVGWTLNPSPEFDMLKISTKIGPKSPAYTVFTFYNCWPSITTWTWLVKENNFPVNFTSKFVSSLQVRNFKCQLPNKQASLHAYSTKGNVSNLVAELIQTHVIEWYVATSHRDMCL